jgi:hypothetical protein
VETLDRLRREAWPRALISASGAGGGRRNDRLRPEVDRVRLLTAMRADPGVTPDWDYCVVPNTLTAEGGRLWRPPAGWAPALPALLTPKSRIRQRGMMPGGVWKTRDFAGDEE